VDREARTAAQEYAARLTALGVGEDEAVELVRRAFAHPV
jgi:Fe2+ transport system protein FeoA